MTTWYTSVGLCLGVLVFLLFCEPIRKKRPYNKLLLLLFSISLALTCAGDDVHKGNDGWCWFFGAFMISAFWMTVAVRRLTRFGDDYKEVRCSSLVGLFCAVLTQACICIPLYYFGVL